MRRRRATLPLLAAALAVAAPARATRAQSPMPVLNFRFDVPLGITGEAGVLFNTLRSEGMEGPALVAAVAQHGGRAGIGYRTTFMMGGQFMANAFFARTWRDPIGVPPGQGYAGGDVRVGMLFTSVGVGALVRVSGDRGPRVRLTASVGIGL